MHERRFNGSWWCQPRGSHVSALHTYGANHRLNLFLRGSIPSGWMKDGDWPGRRPTLLSARDSSHVVRNNLFVVVVIVIVVSFSLAPWEPFGSTCFCISVICQASFRRVPFSHVLAETWKAPTDDGTRGISGSAVVTINLFFSEGL